MARGDRTAHEAALRLHRGLIFVGIVLTLGTLGYFVLGFGLLDASYQAVTTVTTIGFREVRPFGTSEKLFTMAYALIGIGAILYTLTTLLETLVEGHLADLWGTGRMERDISRLTGHVIVAGWGRVGRATSHQMHKSGQSVVVDVSAERLSDCPYPHIARSRTDDATLLLERAGADRVVNPQRIGGDRIAAFALQRHVVDLLEVAMRTSDVEFRLEELTVSPGSALAGLTVREAREASTSVQMLALRGADGTFQTDPAPGRVVEPGDVVIVFGTGDQLSRLREAAGVTP